MKGGIIIYNLNFYKEKVDFSDLNIVFSKKITAIEKKIIYYLFIQWEKSDKSVLITEISQDKISKTLDLDLEKIQYNLEKICNKRIFYTFHDKENKLVKGNFPIINSYFIKNQSIFMTLSEELKESYEHNNFFGLLNIRGLLLFEYQHSNTLFLYILNSIKEESEGYISFTLEDFKKLLDIENLYERFYDLERKVLIPVIEDLNKYSNYLINYQKEKKSDSKTSKITNIKIHYINRNLKEIKNQTNFLLSLGKNNINDFSYLYEIIYSSLKVHGYDYVYKTLSFVLKKFKNDKIDNYLYKAINENWLDSYSSNNKELVKVEKEIHTGHALYNELVKAFIKMKIEFLTEDVNFNSLFYKNLFALKNGNLHILKYETDNFFINIEVMFFSNKKSQIKIEKEIK